MFDIGLQELVVIFVIALIVFGPKRLPEIGRTVGKSLREFRRASQDLRQQFEGAIDDEDDEPGAEAAKSAGQAELSQTETGTSPDGAGPSKSLDGSAPTA